MSESEILDLGVQMREAQRAYFRTRSQDALIRAKELEESFDKALLMWGKGQKALPF